GIVNEKLKVLSNLGICPFFATAAVKEVEQWVSFGELNHKVMACSCAADAVLSQLSVDRASVEEYANDNLRVKRYVVVCCDIIEYLGLDAMCSSRAALETISSQFASKLSHTHVSLEQMAPTMAGDCHIGN